MQKEFYDVVVVGAGIVGCSVSYHLTKSGLKVALLDKGRVAGEASQAAAGMLAPLGDEPPDQAHPLQQLAMAALRYYDGLEEQLKQETGMDIGLVQVPTMRPAFDEQGRTRLQAILAQQQQFLPGLQWLEEGRARELEPLLPGTVQGALLSPYERNVQAVQITQAYAQGAVSRGATLVEGRPVGRLILQGQRAVGVETAQGSLHAEAIVLAAGAWATGWHARVPTPPIFPVKGQMMALQATPGLQGMFRLCRSRRPMPKERYPVVQPLLRVVPLDGSSFKDSGRLEWKPRKGPCMRRPSSWQQGRGQLNGMREYQPHLFSR